MKNIIATILVAAALPRLAVAETVSPVAATGRAERTDSVNISPLGGYTLNYEHLFRAKHGLLIEGNYLDYTGDDYAETSGAILLGYRWHWSAEQNSGFLGVNASFEQGNEIIKSTKDGGMVVTTNIDVRSITLTGNVGRRWAWNNGLNLTFRVGAGLGYHDVNVDYESDDPFEKLGTELIVTWVRSLPFAVDGELSLGYAF